MGKRTVAVNDLGLRIGEDHPMAKLTNADIDRLLQLRAETGWGYKRLGRIFEISPSQVGRILRGQHRGQAAMGYRTIEQE